jgi:hypothetical protein
MGNVFVLITVPFFSLHGRKTGKNEGDQAEAGVFIVLDWDE